ncbi:hypothetical protein BDFB_006777 [Asbolus verrucosus]|uniref:Uncharacterized protein n=1 Tax=Asbolus verrucosus TaxID=1661398 RepID=A0A482VB12_ASBVE|nr:hypothetical protein BDFB_006777 [Asbolus verrucosus]
MEATPSKLIMKLSQQIHLSYGTSHTILKIDLLMFLYKIQVHHMILPRDFVPRVYYCEWFFHNENNNVLDVTFFIDEVWFHLESYVNSQNMRTWKTDNLHVYIETPLHPLKIGL